MKIINCYYQPFVILNVDICKNQFFFFTILQNVYSLSMPVTQGLKSKRFVFKSQGEKELSHLELLFMVSHTSAHK